MNCFLLERQVFLRPRDFHQADRVALQEEGVQHFLLDVELGLGPVHIAEDGFALPAHEAEVANRGEPRLFVLLAARRRGHGLDGAAQEEGMQDRLLLVGRGRGGIHLTQFRRAAHDAEQPYGVGAQGRILFGLREGENASLVPRHHEGVEDLLANSVVRGR